jgi:hypothetical protein
MILLMFLLHHDRKADTALSSTKDVMHRLESVPAV